MDLNLNIEPTRIRHKLSTVAGVVPTVPGTGATNTWYPDTTWNQTTDIMVGETFINTADSRVWFRSDAGIYELGYSGQTGTFLILTDTPSSYAGSAGLTVRVNSGETGLEFSSSAQTYQILQATDFLDTPNSADTSKYMQYDWDTSGFTLVSVNTDFIDLDDVDGSSYTIANGLWKTNSAATGLEEFTGSDTYVDKTSVQTIGGAKTLSALATFNSGIVVGTSLRLSGLTDTTITSIQTGTGFTNVNNSTLATTENIFNFVNGLVQSGTTGLTSFVTLDTTQTVSGAKTFSASMTTAALVSDSIVSQSGLTIASGNLTLPIASYQYFGDESTDGSYRFNITPTADFTIDRRTSGSWDGNIFTITTNGVAIGTYTGSTGNYNFTMGYECQANGSNAVAGGSNSQASGSRSFVFGTSCLSQGTNSFAIGIGSNASGTSSFAGGAGISAGDYSFNYSRNVFNTGSTVYGNDSAILAGKDHYLTHNNSVILGGTGITSAADNTVHMRNLNVSDGITSAGSVGYTGNIVIGGDTCQFANGIFIGVL